jgi:citrate lyase beta subunit
VVEHPAAIRALDDIAQPTPRLVVLGFGLEEYASATGVKTTYGATPAIFFISVIRLTAGSFLPISENPCSRWKT